MKKRILTIASLIMSLILATGIFSGCNLVTKDNERDMNQVVATVKIDENAPKDEILKKDMVMAYLNYGYIYVQYYGYTQEKVFKQILDNLIQTRIIVQYAMKQNESISGYNVEDYLNDEQKLEAKYNTYKSLNDLLNGYIEDENAGKVGDALVETARTVPTGATNAVKKLTAEEKQAYIDAGFKIDGEYRTAFNDVISLMKNNGLLGDKYDGKTLESTAYFNTLLQNCFESELIEAFEKNITDEARAITFEELETAYTEKLDKQKAWNNADFVSALSSATAGEPILYSAFGKYGYIYNLLIGANDLQTADINNIKTDNPVITDEDYAVARKEILDKTVVKDLRSTWILSGYDFDGEKFTGDYTFTSPENSLKFQGTVNKLTDATDDTPAEYSVTALKTFGLREFIEFMDGYVYGDATKTPTDNVNNDIRRKVECSADIEEYDEKINELLFAFSTDPGSLNKYKGYVIKPAVDGTDSEEYVKTFADAGRDLLEMGDKSYIIVASDYGYHIMFFSEVIDSDYGFETLNDYLLSLDGAKDWKAELTSMLAGWEDYEETDSFLYAFVDSLTSAKVNEKKTQIETSVVNEYRYEKDGCVVINESVYQDLFN